MVLFSWDCGSRRYYLPIIESRLERVPCTLYVEEVALGVGSKGAIHNALFAPGSGLEGDSFGVWGALQLHFSAKRTVVGPTTKSYYILLWVYNYSFHTKVARKLTK